jgi:hypothetical protein
MYYATQGGQGKKAIEYMCISIAVAIDQGYCCGSAVVAINNTVSFAYASKPLKLVYMN